MSNIDFKQPSSDPPLQKINLSPLAFLSEVSVIGKKKSFSSFPDHPMVRKIYSMRTEIIHLASQPRMAKFNRCSPVWLWSYRLILLLA